MNQSAGKKRLGCLPLVLVCCGLAVLVAAGLFAWRKTASHGFDTAISSIANAGFPTTSDELLKDYDFDAAENPGHTWVEAGNNFDGSSPAMRKLPFIGPDFDGEDPPKPGEPWDQLAAAKTYLTKHAKLLRQIDEAANSPKPSRYDIRENVDSPGTSTLPYQSTHRTMNRVLSVACYVYAHDGNIEKLTKTINNGLKVGQSLSDEPIAMGQLLSSACTQMMLANLEDLISADFTDEQLQEIQATLRSFKPHRQLLKGLQGNAVQGIEGFQSWRLGPSPRYDDGAFFAEQMLPLMETAKQENWPETLKAMEEVRAAIKATEQNAAQKAVRAFALLQLPTSIALVQSEASFDAHLKAHDALVAARRFELAHGRLPNSISELVPQFLPEVPIDPFSKDGKPMILDAENGAFKIYSRGANYVDDGADESTDPSPSSNRPLDIAVELKK